jgi:TonB family protein
MTVPTKAARPEPSRPRVREAPEPTREKLPTTGPREQLGSAVAETGGQGIGLGLSTGGGGTGGEINVGDFCCPEYLTTMLQLIQRNWNEKQPVGGTTTMRFTIRRDGSITDVSLERSSGYTALDLAAHRALGLTRLPPLPAAYTNPQLTLNLHFQYKR